MHEHDVWLYVLEGEMHARVGDQIVKATPGCRGNEPPWRAAWIRFFDDWIPELKVAYNLRVIGE